MSFETNVTLGIEVDSGELRSAKRAIEDELGDVTVGVSGGGAASRAAGGGSAGGGASGQRSRRLFRWARQRTGYMEETVELLSSIEENIDEAGGLVGGGGGGGGGGGTNILPIVSPGGMASRAGPAAGVGASAGLQSLAFQDLISGDANPRDLLTGPALFPSLGVWPLVASNMAAFEMAGETFGGGLSPDTTTDDRLTFGGRTGSQLLSGQSGFRDIPGTAPTFDTPSSGQIRQALNQEPEWLNRLEQIMNQNLRLTVDGQVRQQTSIDINDPDIDALVDRAASNTEQKIQEVRRDIERALSPDQAQGL